MNRREKYLVGAVLFVACCDASTCPAVPSAPRTCEDRAWHEIAECRDAALSAAVHVYSNPPNPADCLRLGAELLRECRARNADDVGPLSLDDGKATP